MGGGRQSPSSKQLVEADFGGVQLGQGRLQPGPGARAHRRPLSHVQGGLSLAGHPLEANSPRLQGPRTASHTHSSHLHRAHHHTPPLSGGDVKSATTQVPVHHTQKKPQVQLSSQFHNRIPHHSKQGHSHKTSTPTTTTHTHTPASRIPAGHPGPRPSNSLSPTTDHGQTAHSSPGSPPVQDHSTPSATAPTHRAGPGAEAEDTASAGHRQLQRRPK